MSLLELLQKSKSLEFYMGQLMFEFQDKLINKLNKYGDGNNFTYGDFKDIINEYDDALNEINYFHKKQFLQGFDIYSESLNRKLCVFSNKLFYENIDNLLSKYKLLKNISSIWGVKSITHALDYLSQIKPEKLSIHGYNFRNTPISAIIHILLYSRPEKKIDTKKLKYKLKQYPEDIIWQCSFLSFSYSRIFENALEKKNLRNFLLAMNSLNNFKILNKMNLANKIQENPFSINNDNEIQEGILKYKYYKILSNITKNELSEFCKKYENQLVSDNDLIYLLKAFLGINHDEIMREIENKNPLAIKAYGLLPQDFSVNRRLDFFNNLIYSHREDYKRYGLCGLHNLSSVMGFEYPEYFIMNQFMKRNSSFIVSSVSSIKDATSSYKILNSDKVIEQFENIMNYQLQINKDFIEQHFKKLSSKILLDGILFINEDKKFGVYDQNKKIITFDNKEYSITNLYIPHCKHLEKSKLIEKFRKYYFKNKKIEAFPQIFRPYLNEYHIENIYNYIDNFSNIDVKYSWKNQMFNSGWDIDNSGKYIYKDKNHNYIVYIETIENIDNAQKSITISEIDIKEYHDDGSFEISEWKKINKVFLSELIINLLYGIQDFIININTEKYTNLLTPLIDHRKDLLKIISNNSIVFSNNNAIFDDKEYEYNINLLNADISSNPNTKHFVKKLTGYVPSYKMDDITKKIILEYQSYSKK